MPAKPLNQNPDLLLIEKLERIFVLGKRVEAFFEHQIQQSEDYLLKISNLQIIQNKKTLGELDFIIEEIATGQRGISTLDWPQS